jgi:hypothetical protein
MRCSMSAVRTGLVLTVLVMNIVHPVVSISKFAAQPAQPLFDKSLEIKVSDSKGYFDFVLNED